MIDRCGLCAMLCFLLGTSALAASWQDPSGDTLEGVPEPALDLIGVSTSFQYGTLVVTLSFNPETTTPEDLSELGGFVDVDVDLNPETGRTTHLDEFGFPSPVMGVDYYLELVPLAGLANLVRIIDGMEEDVLTGIPTTTLGTVVSITIPRCSESNSEGICILANFELAVSITNNSGTLTDGAPNDGPGLRAYPAPGDYDSDGDVDASDLEYLCTCMAGDAIPADPDCQTADLDGDGDIDQSDFGLLQAALTDPA